MTGRKLCCRPRAVVLDKRIQKDPRSSSRDRRMKITNGKTRNLLRLILNNSRGDMPGQRLRCPIQNLVTSPKQSCEFSLPVLFINL